MSVDLLVKILKAIPTFRQAKDEAGNPLERVAEIGEKTPGQLKVFSGFVIGAMIGEMELGFSGRAGRKREAFDILGRIQPLSTMMSVGTIDIMIARGVFKPTTRNRNAPPAPGVEPAAAGRISGRPVPPRMTHDQIRDALQKLSGTVSKGLA
jgi:hypothetical protein